MRLCVALAAWLTFSCFCAFAEERVTATGKIVGADGNPIERASVMVYSAGVKKGYSAYCPTCWVDCGKHTFTDPDGKFTIGGLSADLRFTLVVVREGYTSTYIHDVDPETGPAADTVLKPRPPVKDASQTVLGRVVDVHGKPVRDAVVEEAAITFRHVDGKVWTTFNSSESLDPMAVTNEKGEFEIAYGKPAIRMTLQVIPRGMAPKLFTEPTGSERHTMTVSDGATIRGRLMFQGKPVANAQVGLMTHRNEAGTSFAEVRIGTREDGTFAITNVPAGRIWNLYPKMESLAGRGIGGDIVFCETKDDGQEVDVGDVELQPTYTVRGRLVLSDGKKMAPHMRVTLSADRAWDSQFAELDSDGRFEFRGVPRGVFSLMAGVRGYELHNDRVTEVLVRGDVNDFVLRLEPARPSE